MIAPPIKKASYGSLVPAAAPKEVAAKIGKATTPRAVFDLAHRSRQYIPSIAKHSPTGSVRNPSERSTKEIRAKAETRDSEIVRLSNPSSPSILWKAIMVTPAQKNK